MTRAAAVPATKRRFGLSPSTNRRLTESTTLPGPVQGGVSGDQQEGVLRAPKLICPQITAA